MSLEDEATFVGASVRDRGLAQMVEGVWAIRPEALGALFRQAVALPEVGIFRPPRDLIQAGLFRQGMIIPLALGERYMPQAVGPGNAAQAVKRGAGAPQQAIAVLPVHGPISQHEDLFTMLFGGVSTEWLGAQMQALAADPRVGAIVLDVDSPGGIVYGVEELAEQIRALRGSKPIISVANSVAASAAYYIAAQADQVVVTPSGEVGSIGVFVLHGDMSGMLAQMGVKATFIQFGENKTLGNPFEPLSERAKAELQAKVDLYGRQFVRDVALGRNVSEKRVMEDFGQGLMFGAQDAVRLGLADRVGTLGDVLA